MPTYSPWRPFPDPRKQQFLTAPFGPGVSMIRRRDTKRLICFGIGRNVAARMSSLLPRLSGGGCGTRNNADKRRSILRNLANIEYKTLPCRTRAEAAAIERDLRPTHDWLYST